MPSPMRATPATWAKQGDIALPSPLSIHINGNLSTLTEMAPVVPCTQGESRVQRVDAQERFGCVHTVGTRVGATVGGGQARETRACVPPLPYRQREPPPPPSPVLTGQASSLPLYEVDTPRPSSRRYRRDGSATLPCSLHTCSSGGAQTGAAHSLSLNAPPPLPPY